MCSLRNKGVISTIKAKGLILRIGYVTTVTILYPIIAVDAAHQILGRNQVKTAHTSLSSISCEECIITNFTNCVYTVYGIRLAGITIGDNIIALSALRPVIEWELPVHAGYTDSCVTLVPDLALGAIKYNKITKTTLFSIVVRVIVILALSTDGD